MVELIGFHLLSCAAMRLFRAGCLTSVSLFLILFVTRSRLRSHLSSLWLLGMPIVCLRAQLQISLRLDSGLDSGWKWALHRMHPQIAEAHGAECGMF